MIEEAANPGFQVRCRDGLLADEDGIGQSSTPEAIRCWQVVDAVSVPVVQLAIEVCSGNVPLPLAVQDEPSRLAYRRIKRLHPPVRMLVQWDVREANPQDLQIVFCRPSVHQFGWQDRTHQHDLRSEPLEGAFLLIRSSRRRP